MDERPRGRFKDTYELLNLRALKFSPLNKIYFFQCMGKITGATPAKRVNKAKVCDA